LANDSNLTISADDWEYQQQEAAFKLQQQKGKIRARIIKEHHLKLIRSALFLW
jgi:hypothetical protein